MLDVKIDSKGEVQLSGRFDASQVEKAKAIFDGLKKSCTVNFKELEYISSAGLSVLLATQKRLSESDQKLKLINLNKYIGDVFRYAGFDTIFEIE
jgi:anti-sigma B factor antagonist